MSARGSRSTNNSVSTLEEQSDVLGLLLGDDSKQKEKDKKKVVKEKKKKETVDSGEKSPVTKVTKTSVTVSQHVPVTSTITSRAVPTYSSFFNPSMEDNTDWPWQAQMQAQAQAQALQLQQFGNFVPNFAFGMGAPPQWNVDWSHLGEPGQTDHSISDDESSSVISVEQPLQLPEEIPDPVVEVKVPGSLADFMKEELVHVKDSDRVAPKLNVEVAVVMDKILKESVLVTEMDKLAKTYPRVENIEHMKVPRLDAEVFEVIDPKVRSMDQGLQSIQKAIMAAVSAIAPVLELNYVRNVEDSELNDLGRNIGESVKLLGFAANAISAKRRELIKPCLAPTYAKVLTKGHETTPEWLFGGDLVSTTKKCEVSQKLGEKLIKRKQPVVSQSKSQGAKRFKGPRGPGMFRASLPYQTGYRFPSPQAFQPYYPQLGFHGGFQPRPYRPRQPQQQQANQQGFPKKQNNLTK